MRHTKHLWRAALLLLLLPVGYVIFRHEMMPPSFGLAGYYRYNSVLEFASQNVVHPPSSSCAECHREEYETHRKMNHKTVACTNCHAPVRVHAMNGKKVADSPVDRSATACMLCHNRLRARPSEFPAIDMAEHLEGDLSDPEACLECHEAHGEEESHE